LSCKLASAPLSAGLGVVANRHYAIVAFQFIASLLIRDSLALLLLSKHAQILLGTPFRNWTQFTLPGSCSLLLLRRLMVTVVMALTRLRHCQVFLLGKLQIHVFVIVEVCCCSMWST